MCQINLIMCKITGQNYIKKKMKSKFRTTYLTITQEKPYPYQERQPTLPPPSYARSKQHTLLDVAVVSTICCTKLAIIAIPKTDVRLV